jgi:hypothetical protein
MPVTQLELVRQLVVPTARSMTWVPLAVAALTAPLITHFMAGSSMHGLSDRLNALRIAGVAVAVAMGFVLDDPARDSTQHQPVPLLLRRTLRAGLALPAVALIWAVCLWLGFRTWGQPDPFSGVPSLELAGDLPLAALTLEFAGLVAVALALSAAATPFVPEAMGGVAAGPIVILLALVGALLSAVVPLFVSDPTGPRWEMAHKAWWAILATGLAAFALWSGDPGRWRLAARVRTPGAERSRGSRTPPAPALRSGTPVRSSGGPVDR